MNKLPNKDTVTQLIDRAGKAAAEALGTDEYPTAFRKLKECFNKYYHHYIFYALNKKGYYFSNRERDVYGIYSGSAYGDLDNSFSLDGEKWDCFQIFAITALEEFDKYAVAIIERYNDDKANGEFGFFVCLNSYIEKTALRKCGEFLSGSYRGDIVLDFTREKKQLLKKIISFMDSVGTRHLNYEQKCTIAEQTGASLELIDEVIFLNRNATPLYLDTPLKDAASLELELSLGDVIADGNSSLSVYMDDGEDLSFDELLILNEIYENSFEQTHRSVFPLGFTNDKITAWVRDTKNYFNCKSDNAAIAEHWDDLNIAERKAIFATGEYYCISLDAFLLFEKLRRIVYDKELAEVLNMKSPRFNKIFTQAKELVRTKLKERINAR